MSTTSPDVHTRHAVQLFKEKLRSAFEVDQTLLFGSRARNAHQPQSDADVAVILQGPAGEFVETKLAMDDLAFEVLLDTGIRIQPLPIWHEEWAHPECYNNPRLMQNIQRDGVVL